MDRTAGIAALLIKLAFKLLTCSIFLSCYASAFFSSSTRSRISLSRGAGAMRMVADDDRRISVARSFALSFLGVNDPSLISEGAEFPEDNSLSKAAYISRSASAISAFKRALPDLDFRPFHFEVDSTDPRVVWLKIRPAGTLSGPYSYKGEVYLPPPGTNKKVFFPVQQLSLTIDDNNKITRVSPVRVVDRLSGNTGGLAGADGLLQVLGEGPNSLLYTPPLVALGRLFARPPRPAAPAKSPVVFPAPVLIAIAKQVAGSYLIPLADPTILSSDFTYSSPLSGPLDKQAFLSSVAALNLTAALPGLTVSASNFEVDPLEPDRVWLIARFSSPLYKSGPEAVSVRVDAQGLVAGITGGYRLGTLPGDIPGGAEAALAAAGKPLSPLQTLAVRDVVGIVSRLFSGKKQKTTPPPKQAPPVPVIKREVTSAPAAPKKPPVAAPVKAVAPVPAKPSAPVVKTAISTSVKPTAPIVKPTAPVKPAAPIVKPAAPVVKAAPAKPAAPVVKPAAPVVKAAAQVTKAATPVPAKPTVPAVKAATPAPAEAPKKTSTLASSSSSAYKYFFPSSPAPKNAPEPKPTQSKPVGINVPVKPTAGGKK